MSRGGVSSEAACDPVRGMVVIPCSKKREPLIARLFAKLLVKEKEPTRRRDRFESRAPQLPRSGDYVFAGPPARPGGRRKCHRTRGGGTRQVLTQQSERIMPISQQIAVVM